MRIQARRGFNLAFGRRRSQKMLDLDFCRWTRLVIGPWKNRGSRVFHPRGTILCKLQEIGESTGFSLCTLSCLGNPNAPGAAGTGLFTFALRALRPVGTTYPQHLMHEAKPDSCLNLLFAYLRHIHTVRVPQHTNHIVVVPGKFGRRL